METTELPSQPDLGEEGGTRRENLSRRKSKDQPIQLISSALTDKQLNQLKKVGELPVEVMNAITRHGNKVEGDLQRQVVEEIQNRFTTNRAVLPPNLNQIFYGDMATQKAIKVALVEAKSAESNSLLPSIDDQGHGRIGTSTAQTPPANEQNYQPFGWQVGIVERADQLSDSDHKPGNTIEFRFNPVSHETPLQLQSDSTVEALKIAEQVEAKEFELILPAEAEEIRAFLQNDGYLSNEEISRALYDASLTKEELHDKINSLDTSQDSDIIEKITDYLWDVHNSVLDSPLADFVGHEGKWELQAISINPEESAQSNQLVIDGQPRDPDLKTQKADEEGEGLVRSILKLKTFEGGMIANLLHNYTLVQQITEKLFNLAAIKPTQEMETTQTTRYEWKDIAAQLEKHGITESMLEKSGNLNALLNGRRTEVMDLARVDADGTSTPVSGKLYITEVPDKGPVVFLSPKRQDITIPQTYRNYNLTPEDRAQLLATGEMGKKVVMIDKVDGKPYEGYIGVDKENNSLTCMRAERFTAPTILKGVELTQEQQNTLRNHGVIRVVGMNGVDNKPFTADVQLSINKRALKFVRVNEQAEKLKVENPQQKLSPTEGAARPTDIQKLIDRIPAKIHNVPLSDQQRQDLAASKTIRLEGMTRNGSKPFTGDVTLNLEQSKLQIERIKPLRANHQKLTEHKLSDSEKINPKVKAPNSTQRASAQDTKQEVSIQHKNGSQRISESKSTGSTTKGQGQSLEKGKQEKQTKVNGKTKASETKPGNKPGNKVKI